MCESSRTCCAVVRVPSPVCSVTAKMCWMFSATSLARTASREVDEEISSISSARWRDTESISVSAVPAESDRRAPRTGEGRGGEEGRSRGAPDHLKKKKKKMEG